MPNAWGREDLWQQSLHPQWLLLVPAAEPCLPARLAQLTQHSRAQAKGAELLRELSLWQRHLARFPAVWDMSGIRGPSHAAGKLNSPGF